MSETGKQQVIRNEKGQIVKGSGNYAGRPKGSKNFTTEVKEALLKIAEGSNTTYQELLVRRVLKLAIEEGNEKMIKLIWNYLDGLPTQNIDLGGQVNIAYIDILKAIKEKEQLYDTNRTTNTENKK